MGRKRIVKSWDTRLRHEYRTAFESDSAAHIFMFIAGDHATELLNAALRNFANALDIPIDDPEFQHTVFMQAASMQASNKQAPYPSDVLAALGRTDILDTLNRTLGIKSEGLPAPKPAPIRTAAAPQAKRYAAPLAAVQTKHESTLPSAPAPVAVSPVVTSQPPPVSPAPVASAPVQRKPPPQIDMGPEIDLDTPASNQGNGQKALKNRWLSAHDY